MNLEQQQLSVILETAIVAARAAGQRAMEEINFVKASVKNETELVTATDSRCQRLIMDRVKEMFPDHGFIAEEGDQGKLFKLAPRGEPALWWVIDPIDGTNNFAHGLRVFAISIAVCFEGRPVAGVIFEPATESMYSAVEGGEAQLNGRRIMASDEGLSLLTSVGLDSHFGDTPPAGIFEIMRRTRFRNFGSTALQLAYVAQGGLAGTVLSTPKLWDIAAGVIILQAAGGLFTDWRGDGMFPIDLDRYQGEPFRSIGANKRALPQLIELMRA